MNIAESVKKLLADDFGGEPGKRDILVILADHIDAIEREGEVRQMALLKAINGLSAQVYRLETVVKEVEQRPMVAEWRADKRSLFRRLFSNG